MSIIFFNNMMKEIIVLIIWRLRRTAMTTRPFFVKDCALAVIATGESATSLAQLKEVLRRIPESSIYYHFWGERLRPSFVHTEYQNDFSRWTHEQLHDKVLSERLDILDPTEFSSLEDLRNEIIEIIDERIDELEYVFWTKKEVKFHFLRSIIIVFDMGETIQHPSELKGLLPKLPTSSIYLHFIDARKRTEKKADDFSSWLMEFGKSYSGLVEEIQQIDPYFLSLAEVKQKLIEIVNKV